LERFERSISWRALQVLRARLYGWIGEDSTAARLISATLRAGARIAEGRHAERPIAVVPPVAAPLVSMILPVHGQPELTAACVRALEATVDVPWELIVVDDAASQEVRRVVAGLAGATVVRNERNLGYTASLNRGLALARGTFAVLLNDDVEPRPGWLAALLACARDENDAGIVGPMYLAPDGGLKEAGSIIWRDGTAENFGRGDPEPGRARYLTRRDVDYASGACLLVRMDALRGVGGLDEAFSPAYYEDVDLCFAVRRAGFRVLYEPAAQVIHVEGATAGTDEQDVTSTKHYQVINQASFARKWASALAGQPVRGGDPRFGARHRARAHVLVADHGVPAPGRDGGSRRMAAIVDELTGLGCAVTVLPVLGGRAEDVQRLRDRGVEVLRPEDVEPELAALGPRLDLALLSRPHVAARFAYTLRRVAPRARLVYDTVDLHHRREALQAQVEGVEPGRAIDALRELELAMTRTCDVTLVVTEEERDILARAVPDAVIEVLGTVAQPVDRPAGLADRNGIVFAGSYLHPPNVDAAVFLVRDVMPEVWRRHPGAVLRLVGEEPPDAVRALAGPEVEVTGFVDDLAAALDGARVAVAPARFGAGLKIKSVDAMARGLPVVTTPLGAEGLGDGALVGDSAEALAVHVSALLADDALWRRWSERGRAITEARFGRQTARMVLQGLLRASQPSRKA
jgi:GT2 family glycosyltransferase/glycosyltransferase involved in cell wall biosynthesis